MELELIKKVKYNLEPYGKFTIKWNTKQGWKPNIIPYGELRYNYDSGMPLSEEQDKEVIKLMKKYKTDILTDGEKYYTRIGIGLGEVHHKKLSMYKTDEAFRNAVDEGHSFGKKD